MPWNPDTVTLLDGAMGTMLQKMGLRPGQIPEMTNLTHPEWVRNIHAGYIAAGSRIIYANPFGANRLKLKDTGHTVREIVAAGVGIAREAAAGTDALVGLDVGPLGALLEPLGTLPFEEAYGLFAEIVEAGRDAGADLIAIETMTDLQEARAALLAAKEHASLPVFVTMSFDPSGRTFTGCAPSCMARVLEGLGADAVGLNCSLGPREALPLVKEIARNTRLPVIAKPNAGLPDPVDGHYDLSPAGFADAMKALAEAGATVVGGCCGTDPAYISALRDALAGVVPARPAFDETPFVCTASVPLPLDRPRVIGERINPTGKKRFQQALMENDLNYIVGVAVQQMDAGAEILDVNVGYPGVDEEDMLPRVVKALQSAVDIPLQLDSVSPAALEAALRVYCGKAAVNSVSGKESSLEALLPIVKKYGAAVVGLALDDAGLPDTAEKRVEIAEKILARATAAGIHRQDVWIDCLTLTVSAQQEQARETLRAVERVSREMGLPTVLGVSNISFGLPERQKITQAFLLRALQAGLTLPIVNPNQQELMDLIAANRALNGEDPGCAGYIARFAGAPASAAVNAAPGGLSLQDAVIRGLKADAARAAREMFRDTPEMDVVERHLIPALDRVGADYESGRVFLPQLLSAAQAAQSVFEEIKNSLAAKGARAENKGEILLATVQGDIHDIGKNIVKTVLENYGYRVIDLGRDVAPETVVRAAEETGAQLVGLSALMTTTLPAMEETARQLRQMKNAPAVMVGGAVVTAEYAGRIGALYARDARAAVTLAKQVFDK